MIDDADPNNIAFYAVKQCDKCDFTWVAIHYPQSLPRNKWGECPYCIGADHQRNVDKIKAGTHGQETIEE